MSNFDKAFAFTYKWEKGKTKDTGGYTVDGLSSRAYPDLDLNKLTLDEKKAIYKRDYWDKIKGDDMPYQLSLAVFDTAVNCGVRQASLLLQRAINCFVDSAIDTDGIIGPKTIAAVNYAKMFGHNRCVSLVFCELRLCHYNLLYMSSDSYNEFIHGWINRINDLRKEIRNG